MGKPVKYDDSVHMMCGVMESQRPSSIMMGSNNTTATVIFSLSTLFFFKKRQVVLFCVAVNPQAEEIVWAIRNVSLHEKGESLEIDQDIVASMNQYYEIGVQLTKFIKDHQTAKKLATDSPNSRLYRFFADYYNANTSH